MPKNNLTDLSATELARIIAAGEISAVEMLEAHIERIEAVNPQLNAVVVKRYESARSAARQADEKRARGEVLGKLHGVPVTIKEAIDVEETPATFGLPSLKNNIARTDNRFVARLREAGAIILGKTNVAQLLMAFESDNPVYGRTSNPHSLERTAGGSSGGEAAIIAAGGSALGLGTDILGSVRVPAAFCGIAAIKPTAGRTPDDGRFSFPIGQQAVQSQIGVLARTVADAALGLEIINDGGENAPTMPLGDFRKIDISRLRIGFYVDDGGFAVSPAVKRAVLEAAEILRRRGASVVEWQPPEIEVATGILLRLISADGGRRLRQTVGDDQLVAGVKTFYRLLRTGRATAFALEKALRLSGQNSLARLFPHVGHTSAHDYWQSVAAQIDYRERFLAAMTSDAGAPLDALICPAFPLPALNHGAGKDIGLGGAYSPLYNLLGFPAGVAPVTTVRADEETSRPASRDAVKKAARQIEIGSANLPVAVQVAARPWREDIVLAVLQSIEEIAATETKFAPGARVVEEKLIIHRKMLND